MRTFTALVAALGLLAATTLPSVAAPTSKAATVEFAAAKKKAKKPAMKKSEIVSDLSAAKKKA
ncbi:MAG: hypothetical protein KF697_17385, partial [Pseudolabrys sp.]|nr:hypothetical protein [Pseudolabrys sp.]